MNEPHEKEDVKVQPSRPKTSELREKCEKRESTKTNLWQSDCTAIFFDFCGKLLTNHMLSTKPS